MKTILTASATLLSATLCWAAPEPIKFDIYQSSATVSFSAEVNGEGALSIPGAFPPETVKIISVNGANLVSFKAESYTKDDDKAPYYLVAPIKEIDDLTAQLDAKTAKLSSLDLSAAILDGVTSENVKSAELPTLLSTVSALREKNAKEITAINRDIILLKARIKDKEENVRSKLPTNFKKVTVVNVKLSGKGTVVFQADTHSARWQPKYQMNLNSRTGNIETIFSISVTQNTGIIWKGAMEFYSNQPVSDLYYAALPPLLVYLREAMPNTTRKSIGIDGNSLKSQVYMEAEDSMMQESVIEAPQINDSGLYFKLNATIGGDGTASLVPVDKFSISSDSGFQITPEYSRYALLTANVKNLPKPLLGASAEFSIDGAYSASGYLEATPQGGEIVIPFGTSKNISATKTGMIAQKDNFLMKGYVKDGYTISVLNGLDRPVTITVNDRIPFSTNSKISVTKVNIEPKAKENNDGVYKWELQLKPKETKKINVDYEIKFPSDAGIYYR